MKKLIIIISFIVSFLFVCCTSKAPAPNRRLVKVIITNYAKTDSARHYGIYKEVDRRFNYTYHDSTRHSVTYIDWQWKEDYYINEYGDTVFIRYIDCTNYPRREED